MTDLPAKLRQLANLHSPRFGECSDRLREAAAEIERLYALLGRTEHEWAELHKQRDTLAEAIRKFQIELFAIRPSAAQKATIVTIMGPVNEALKAAGLGET